MAIVPERTLTDPAPRPVEILFAMQQALRAGQPALPAEKPVAPRWRGLAFQAGTLPLVADLAAVSDVVEGVTPTRLPGVRHWVRGIANIRGSVYGIVDLAAMWDMAPVENPAGAYLLVLADRRLQCALLVDRVFGLRQFDLSAVESGPAAPAPHPHCRRRLKGPEGEFWMLDVAALIRDDEFRRVAAR
jgi:twitching motility protein PilI